MITAIRGADPDKFDKVGIARILRAKLLARSITAYKQFGYLLFVKNFSCRKKILLRLNGLSGSTMIIAMQEGGDMLLTDKNTGEYRTDRWRRDSIFVNLRVSTTLLDCHRRKCLNVGRSFEFCKYHVLILNAPPLLFGKNHLNS